MKLMEQQLMKCCSKVKCCCCRIDPMHFASKAPKLKQLETCLSDWTSLLNRWDLTKKLTTTKICCCLHFWRNKNIQEILGLMNRKNWAKGSPLYAFSLNGWPALITQTQRQLWITTNRELQQPFVQPFLWIYMQVQAHRRALQGATGRQSIDKGNKDCWPGS